MQGLSKGARARAKDIFAAISMCLRLFVLQAQRAHIQRAQYPLIKEYGLNYIGLHTMI